MSEEIPTSTSLEQTLLNIPKHLFLKRRDLNVAVCSWNIEGRSKITSELKRWVQAKRCADVIVIGIQEVPLGVSDGWTDRLAKILLEFDYFRVATTYRYGLLETCHIKKVHQPFLRNVVKEKTRVNHVFSGKGALALRFTLYSKRFLFVNCHLDHNLSSSEGRKANYEAVLDAIELPLGEQQESMSDCVTKLVDFNEGGRDRAVSSPRGRNLTTSRIGRHDYIFWYGNLNYRVEAKSEDVMLAIAQERYDAILERDQLTMSMRGMSAFSGFYEAAINFPPTYKYFRDKDEYDVSKRSGVRRVPSYTDRILFCCDPSIGATKLLPKKSNMIESLKYKSYPSVRGTDHRPMALMSVVAAYETIESSIERVRDLRDVGMNDKQIAEQLASELGVSLDDEEKLLFRDLEVPDEDDVYSSDEDAEEERKYRRQMRKIQRIENLLLKGPIVRSDKAKEAETTMDWVVASIGELANSKPDYQMESIEVLGEVSVNTMERVDNIPALIEQRRYESLQNQQEADKPFIDAVVSLHQEIGVTAATMDQIMLSLCKNRSNNSPETEESLKIHYSDYDKRAAYYTGYLAGTFKQRAQFGECPEEASLSEKIAELEAREKSLMERSAVAEETLLSLDSKHCEVLEEIDRYNQLDADRLAHEALKESLAREEVKLLRHRAALSREQLNIAAEGSAVESHNADYVRGIGELQAELDEKSLHHQLLSEHLSRKNTRKRSPKRKVEIRTRTWTPGPGGGGGALTDANNEPSLARHQRWAAGDDSPPRSNSPVRVFKRVSLPLSSPDSPKERTMHYLMRSRSKSPPVRSKVGGPTASFLSLLPAARR
eukprot:TRINITY_DN15469_c0_g1_i1.p1 TRINITY_DN15469_c0_g1~~TRINITY_DN15469_c0_g1_i1.p1  ORF type:complete len:829 (+),score=212.87 TRINITY_DN15469_c0_g1_i1:91-2577(+)